MDCYGPMVNYGKGVSYGKQHPFGEDYPWSVERPYEIDWSLAPGWATWHYVQPSGEARFSDNAPSIKDGGFINHPKEHLDVYAGHIFLVYGFDWRCSPQERK